MQTRKRAKSVSFGKSASNAADKEKKETTSHVAESKAVKKDDSKVVETEAAKKVTQAEPILSSTPSIDETPTKVETPSVSDKPKEAVTPPAEKSNVVTPPSEFLGDTSPTAATLTTTPESNEIKPLTMEPVASTEPVSADNSLSPAIESEKSAETPSETPAVSEELSATPPPSAFTIQGNSVDGSAPQGEKKNHFVLYFLLIALVAFLLGLGAMAAVTYGLVKIPGLSSVAFSPKSLPFVNSKPPVTPTVKPETAPTAAPTEAPANLSAFTVDVLNGSGIKGKAAEVKTSLTTAGFKVGATGNADRSDYGTTQIAAKKSVDKAFLTKLENELKKSYKLEPTTIIPTSATGADVTVTLGKTTAK